MAAIADSPLGLPDFTTLMRPVLADDPTGLVVAVSGGPDSVCLMHLLAALQGALALPPVTVATVNHGLRAGSEQEAEAVLAQAGRLGLPAVRLDWEGPKPSRAVQEKAREARYALLSGLCRSHAASHLLTAHTLDDQAETILFRLSRGSGPAGLSGMSARVVRADGVVHARPLLSVPKTRLLATCATAGWDYARDPSNQDPRFARTRMRRLMPMLAAEDLDATRLSRLADRVARSEAALKVAAETAGAASRRSSHPGTERLDGQVLAAYPAELVLRVLRAGIETVGGAGPMRLNRLERLTDEFLAAVEGATPFSRTLNGALLVLRDGLLDIGPEPARRDRRARRAAQ